MLVVSFSQHSTEDNFRWYLHLQSHTFQNCGIYLSRPVFRQMSVALSRCGDPTKYKVFVRDTKCQGRCVCKKCSLSKCNWWLLANNETQWISCECVCNNPVSFKMFFFTRLCWQFCQIPVDVIPFTTPGGSAGPASEASIFSLYLSS